MLYKSLFVVLLFLLTSCTQEDLSGDENMESVTFQTEDNVRIVGNYWEGSEHAVLLLHMMPATKESWEEFGEALNKKGFTVLAIDLRGHGESVQQEGNILNYRNFSDAEHQGSIADVEAAIAYLQEHGATEMSIVGASIGANLALWYQSEHPEIEKTILLSPGTNYRGIIIEPFAEALSEEQEVYFVAGTLDGSAVEMAKQIQNKVPGSSEIKIYESSAHGTDLFAEDGKLMNTLISWL